MMHSASWALQQHGALSIMCDGALSSIVHSAGHSPSIAVCAGDKLDLMIGTKVESRYEAMQAKEMNGTVGGFGRINLKAGSSTDFRCVHPTTPVH